MRSHLGRVAVFMSIVPALAAGQAPSSERTVAELRSRVPQVTAGSVLQVHIEWTTDRRVADPSQTTNRFEVLSARRVRGAMRPERAPQIAPGQLVVVSVGPAGVELDWRSFADARVVRSEAGAQTIGSELLYYRAVQFQIAVPDLPGAVRLDIYSAQRRSGMTVLRPIGSVAVS
jgi:hypothetical protein